MVSFYRNLSKLNVLNLFLCIFSIVGSFSLTVNDQEGAFILFVWGLVEELDVIIYFTAWKYIPHLSLIPAVMLMGHGVWNAQMFQVI